MKKILVHFLPIGLIVLYKKLRIYLKRQRANNIIRDYVKNANSPKLHIGCGGVILNGWLNTDIVLENSKVTYLDAGKQFPLSENSFDYVYSEHLFEHLTYVQQCNYLAEAFRILKPGGKVRIATPNIEFLIKLMNDNLTELEKSYLIWNNNTFLKEYSLNYSSFDYLNVYVINNYFKDWGHQLIHSQGSLEELLVKYNFSNIKFESVSMSECCDLKDLEHHMSQIGEEYNVLETMVIEGTKC